MAEVKWIKIVTNIFDDEKISLIEALPESDTIIVIWFKLLCLAGRSNKNGFLMLNDMIHYNDEMLATIFKRPILTVRLALETFVGFGMIEIIEDEYRIANWEKHQNIDGLEKIREQTRERVAKHRARALENKQCNVTRNATVTQCNETDIELDKEIDKMKNKEDKNTHIDHQAIYEEYNAICVSLPSLRKMTEKRKQAVRTFLKNYSRDELTEVFEMAEQSDFLSGRSGNWNGCGFDWLLNMTNAQKVLEGNYKNKQTGTGNPFADMLIDEGYQQ